MIRTAIDRDRLMNGFMKHGPFDSVKKRVCELHPQGVVLIRFKDHKDAQKCIDAMNGMQREIHTSLDDGSVNHAAVRDFDSEAEWLDQFAAELEAE
uniref:RRM domain-containing protein n=1 Tax=Brassica oleracea var. oleracea TaxID=109376 RepID=A0A0D3E727_BRAOL